jgi:phenylacetate-CoA ligase
MGTIEVIKKFIESNRIVERAVREGMERLPLRLRYGISYGPTFRWWLAFLKESEKWDREKLEAYQVEQLRSLLIHAGKNVPYYQLVFRDYGFRPKEIQSLDEIRALPYLDKTIVKARPSEFIAANIPKKQLIAVTTSGTTGVPFSLYGTKETEEKHWATVVHLWSRIGYRPGSRTVFFESTAREGRKQPYPWKKYGDRLIISSNHLKEPWMDKFIAMINRFKPEYAIGFPQTIAVLSSYIKKNKRDLCESLKGIILVGEQSYAWQKSLIEGVMGVRVFSDYGMVEKVIHGGGCERSDAYHFYPQYGLSEYVPLQDQFNEMVGTGFINYAMPLIRYRTGDICRPVRRSCESCGRPYDTTAAIDGRLCDFLVTADGQIVSVHLPLDHHTLEHIEGFQLYQDKAGEAQLRVWTKGKDGMYVENLLDEIRRCTSPLGRDLEYTIVIMGIENTRRQTKYSVVDQKLDMRALLQ